MQGDITIVRSLISVRIAQKEKSRQSRDCFIWKISYRVIDLSISVHEFSFLNVRCTGLLSIFYLEKFNIWKLQDIIIESTYVT